MNQKQILFGLLLFEMALFPLVTTTVAIPGVKNPISDLIPSYAASASGQGSGTAGGDSGNINSQQQQVQACGIGGLIGGGVGLLGFAFGPVGIATTVGGFALGCYISATFFPQQGSSVFNAITSSVPVIGDFLKAFVAALAYVGQLISFASDSTTYELALLSAAPEIGAFMFPISALTTIWLFIEVAYFVRGTGTVGV